MRYGRVWPSLAGRPCPEAERPRPTPRPLAATRAPCSPAPRARTPPSRSSPRTPTPACGGCWPSTRSTPGTGGWRSEALCTAQTCRWASAVAFWGPSFCLQIAGISRGGLTHDTRCAARQAARGAEQPTPWRPARRAGRECSSRGRWRRSRTPICAPQRCVLAWLHACIQGEEGSVTRSATATLSQAFIAAGARHAPASGADCGRRAPSRQGNAPGHHHHSPQTARTAAPLSTPNLARPSGAPTAPKPPASPSPPPNPQTACSQVSLYFRRFEEAEAAYRSMGRLDLAIALRSRLGGRRRGSRSASLLEPFACCCFAVLLTFSLLMLRMRSSWR